MPFGLLGGGVASPPGGDSLTGGLVGYGMYATKDGRAVALGALEPKFLSAFFTEVGLVVDPALFLPGPHQDETRAKLAAIFRERTQAEWIEIASRGDYCLEPVLTPAEATSDAHLARAARSSIWPRRGEISSRCALRSRRVT
ncbi:MAG: CoA transferase [Polyangiaceae bacterium]